MVPSESQQHEAAARETQNPPSAEQVKKTYRRPAFANLGAIAQYTQGGLYPGAETFGTSGIP